MNINRTILLAGIGTLALTVGMDLASAQEHQKGHGPAPQAAQPHAAPSHASQPAPGRSNAIQPPAANRAVPNRGQAAQGSGRENGRVGQSAAPPRPAQHAQDRGNRANEGPTAQERRVPRGLQGNASGQMQGQHELSEQQRTHIRQTVIGARGAPRVGHVDFDVRVGTRIPRDRIHLVPVPETLVQIDPEWEGFLYFVYDDEIVVVDPNDMEIVAVFAV
jgi:hypothetical protein